MTAPDETARGAGLRRSPAGLAATLAAAWGSQLAALAAAAAVVAATITGAVGVGSALRRGLHDLALERLGGIEAAVVTEDTFGAGLAAGADGLVPAIVIEVGVEAGAPARGAARATLLACDDVARLGFPAPALADCGTSLLPQDAAIDDRRNPQLFDRSTEWKKAMDGFFHGQLAPGDGAVVNAQLAAALGLAPGDAVVVRLPPRSAVPADLPLGRRGGMARGRRLRVTAVLPDAGLGRFALRPAAATRPLVVAPLAVAQELVGRSGAANVLFAVGGASAAVPAAAVAPRLGLDDLGLALEPVAGGRALRLTSRRLVLPPEADRAAAAVLGPLGARPTLAFLATSMRPRDAEDSRVEIPYSTVLGIDATALPVGDLVDDEGRPLPVPADDEILIGRWMADDLAVRGCPVGVGDRLELRTFAPETLHGRVEETVATFRIAGIAALRGAAVERALVPDVEGVTDEDSIADWDPPFPFDRARVRATPPHDEDERYWQAHGAAPKAFVSLAAARRLAGSRFGGTTAWFVPVAAGAADALAARLAPELVSAVAPAALGVRVEPLRAEALAAARGSTPFGPLFLALSSFVVIAGLMLEWLLFALVVAARRRDVGVLAAVGFPPARIAGLLLAIGGAAAVGGVAVGAALGPAWARALLAGLSRAWQGSVEPGAAAAFARWPAWSDVWPAAVAAALVSLLALAWAAWRAGRLPPAALLAGRDDPAGSATPRAGAVAAGAALLTAATGCGLAGRGADPAVAVGLFFAAGFTALGGCLALAWWWLGRRPRGAARSLPRLARRGLVHRRGRAFAVSGIVAVATFLVVAVSVFRLGPPARPFDRGGPTGGWTHVASFAAPTAVDPADATTREDLGLDAAAERVAESCAVALVRSSGGADADCTNLYDTAGRATILGVGPGFVARGGFRFTAVARPDANPWALLGRPVDATGPVPAILDAATAQWALKIGGVGSRFTLPDGAGRPVEFEVVGLLDLSILQGFVIVAEREFERMFPAGSGYRLALVDATRALAAGATPPDVSRALAAAWIDAAPEVVPAVTRLARLQAVQNTFLAAFQGLGTLGLLLGTAGVAAVQAQGVAERRGQLSLLRAIGFTPARLRGMLVLETVWTVGLGLVAGAAAGLLAVAPLARGDAAGSTLAWVAATCGLVFAVAVTASLGAAAWQAIPERPQAD